MTATDFAPALTDLIADAGTWLLDQYGTCTNPVRGYSYHNHQEQQHLAGVTTPDREATLRFMAFQVGLFRDHRYLLPVTGRLYPHRQANADRLAHLADLYAADRISRADLLARARA